MIRRPILIGALTCAAAVTALHNVGAPPGATLHLRNADESSIGATSKERKTSRTDTAAYSWSDQLKNDPEAEGRKTAEEELQSKICQFVPCPPADSIGVQAFASWLVPLPVASSAEAATPMYSAAPQIVLAITPDPIHTHGALLFDRLVDAAEDALQDSGWDYQGSWLPWKPSSGKPDGTIEDREEERRFDSGIEEYPGVILFRPSDPQTKKPPLIVLVSGDSATSGVVKSQFQKSLQIFFRLSSSNEPLRILGPDYSGAGPSLSAMLKNAKDRYSRPLLESRSVFVASGTVSDSVGEHFVPGAGPVPTGGDDPKKPTQTFISFSIDSGWEVSQLCSFLERRGHLQSYQIAELSEDESRFGEIINEKSECGESLHLKFPRGISHLRNAYQKNAIWGFGGSSSANSVSLSLDFEEPREADDSVPIFAQQQLPVSQEASMGQVASILENRQVKAVLVSASDVLDELFVSQFLARQAPNVMVILRGTDVLFLRSGSFSHNTYLVSPWPLIPVDAAWTKTIGGQPLARSFSSGDSEGVYTAMRYLVREKIDRLQDYRSPVDTVKVRSTVSDYDRAPLWFSMIGHGSFWPVALLNDGHDRRSPINLPPLRQQPRAEALIFQPMSLSQYLMLLIAVGLSGLHAGKCLRLRMLDRIAPWYHSHDKSTRTPKLVLQFLISILGILITCLLYEPPRSLAPSGELVPQLLSLGLFATAILFLVLAAVHVARMLLLPMTPTVNGQNQNGVTTDRWGAVVVPVTMAISLVLWIVTWNLLHGPADAADGTAMFFDFRSSHPLSGASPVFPLFLALNGLVLVLLSRICLFSFSSLTAPRLPNEVPPSLNCPGPRAACEIMKLLRWPIVGRSLRDKAKTIIAKLWLFGTIAVSVFMVAWSMNLVPHMFEYQRSQIVLTVALYLVVVALLWDLTMAAVLWNRLKAGLLIPLESSSLRRGFNSISGLTWKSLWLMPQSPAVQYRALTRSMEQASRTCMDPWADAPVAGTSLRQSINQMWRSYSDGLYQDSIANFCKVQKRLAFMGQKLLLHLQQLWSNELSLITEPDHRDGTTSSANAQSKPDLLTVILEEWVALIYIHYIRLILVHIRTRLAISAMLYVLLVWAITSYPFINRHSLTIGLCAILGVLAVTVISTYASINRDPILSRTINERPDRLDLDFVWKTASMVGIPLLGLVASQFPEVSRFLFSWIEPGMSAIK